MNVPSRPAENTPRLIQSLALPHNGETEPGPLHSIVTDEDGNIYYSDEFNHSVLSLKGDGSVRWQKTTRGAAPGEFWYPRGLSIGFLQLNGETIRCLAIADAWNRRVQFLDCDGSFLTGWTHGDKTPFGEVSDVRFIPQNTAPESHEAVAGFWYVLDRGNHRLCRFGIKGDFIDHIGRGFPPSMENRWAAPQVFFGNAHEESQTPSKFLPFDFTFYPDRILGHTIDTLCVCESNSRKIKLVRPPHIIPVCIDTESNLVGIEADHSGLLAWDDSRGRLLRLDEPPGECDQADIIGRPVASNHSCSEFWTQTGDGIRRWNWCASAKDLTEDRKSIIDSMVSRTAAIEIGRLDLTRVQTVMEGCFSVIDEELGLADNILAASDIHIDQPLLDGMAVHLNAYKVKCSWSTQHLQEALHHWCLGQLGLHIAGTVAEKTPDPSTEVERMQSSLGLQIQNRLGRLQERIEGLSCGLALSQANGGTDATRIDSWIKVASIAKSGLEYAKEWMSGWSGIMAS